MQFSAKEDLDVPIDDAFNLLSEYDVFERMAMRRGIEVVRNTDASEFGVGSSWKIDFDWRGKAIKMRAEIVTFERPERVVLDVKTQGLDIKIDFELVALSRKRTRLHLVTDIDARTLPMRLLVQSMKLARGNIDKKLQERFQSQCRNLEDRYQMAS
ncbi:SRPBCC family protein [Cognatishimia sp. WU-CL00825]|uniref:SRPBCC family protein n=1 Tax=Cognatishimia sp. WU-CL00825 TaxID=3127658 RepID=UPI003103BF89